MKQWQPAMCHLVMQMILANSTFTTTSTPMQNIEPILKPSSLSPVLNWNGRSKSRAKENSTRDMGKQIRSSEVTTSTLRTRLIPVYVRLQSTNKISQPYKTQFNHKTIGSSPKTSESITKLFTQISDIAPDVLLGAEPDISEVASSEITSLDKLQTQTDNYSDLPEMMHPVQHAALPRGLKAYPLPLEGSDHELQLNVTWLPNTGPQVSDYSLEVRSVTDTVDCMTPLCYEYDIPGNSLWWVVPSYPSPVAESCAVRPGCAYTVRLIAHPWDGHTSANLNVELDECVAGVCSCAHAPRLPTPRVSARAVSVHGELFVNVTWDLPPPQFPYRLPSGLKKQYFFVSIGKQMVSDAHPSPWFAHSISRRVDIDTPVTVPEEPRWILLPTVERSGERSAVRLQSIMLDVKLLARVNLIDERGCVGPAGNATAYDPTEAKKISYTSYAVWAIFGGVFVLALITLLAVSARIVKRVLNIFRPAPAAASLEPLRNHPIWFPLNTVVEL